jgi:hypothetical protein
MSRSIEIPGGTAELFDDAELTPRRQRPVQELALQVGALMERLAHAKKVTTPDGETDERPSLSGLEDIEISDRQAAQLTRLQDLVTFMYLKSWSLPDPLPADADALLDLPSALYDVISKAAAQSYNGTAPDTQPVGAQFEASDETLENDASPTGASGV